VDIINILLDKGMYVNFKNTDYNTPLRISAKFGHLEATKALVKRGAALYKRNKFGNTPLMMALYNGKLEILRYLREL
jgi:ankyrin repeat protein